MRDSSVEALRALQTALPSAAFFSGAAFDAPRQRSGVPGTYLGTVPADAADVLERQLTG